MAMRAPWTLLFALSLQLGDSSDFSSHGELTVVGSSYSDLGELIADFCQGSFKTTLMYVEHGVKLGVLLLRLLHVAGCAANVVVESADDSANSSGENVFAWTRDPHQQYKVLLANLSHRTVTDLLEPLTPLKAQVGDVCHLALPEARALRFQEPVVPFRSLKCCRLLNVGLGPPDDVPADLVAVQQRASGVTLTLYAAEGFRRLCTYCGFMHRLDNGVVYMSELSGAHLVVSARNNTPYVVVGRRGPDDEYRLQEGVELKLLKAIGNKLNFTYTLSVNQSAEFGALKNGTWTGLVGDVLYRESHMAMGEVSVTDQRTEVITYLSPVLFDVLTYVTKAPKAIPFTLAVVRPFRETVWTWLGLALAASSAFLFCLRWSPVDRGRSNRPDFWFLLSTLTHQNPWEEDHRSAGYRVFLGPWWLLVLVLTTVYSGRLVSIMSVAVFEPWLNDPGPLEEALTHRKILVCTHSKTIFVDYFKVANSGVLYQVRVHQLEGGMANTLLVSDRKTGLERTLFENYVYVDTRMSIMTGMELLSEPETRRLRVAGGHLGIEYFSFVFQKGCPLCRAVNARSRELFETGHMHHWTVQTILVTLPAHVRPEYVVESRPDSTKNARERVPLTMSDFTGIACLLGIGYALGIVALTLEMASNLAKGSWRRRGWRSGWPTWRTRSSRELARAPGVGGSDPLVVVASASLRRPGWRYGGLRAEHLFPRQEVALWARPRLIRQRNV